MVYSIINHFNIFLNNRKAGICLQNQNQRARPVQHCTILALNDFRSPILFFKERIMLIMTVSHLGMDTL